MMSETAGIFAMGGYGVFVWSAYAVAFVLIGGLVVHSIARLRARTREAAAVEAAAPRRRRARAAPDGGDDP